MILLKIFTAFTTLVVLKTCSFLFSVLLGRRNSSVPQLTRMKGQSQTSETKNLNNKLGLSCAKLSTTSWGCFLSQLLLELELWVSSSLASIIRETKSLKLSYLLAWSQLHISWGSLLNHLWLELEAMLSYRTLLGQARLSRSFTEGCLPPKVVFHQRSSPLKVVFHQRCLPPKVVFHQRSTSTESCLSLKDIFHQRSSSIKGHLH